MLTADVRWAISPYYHQRTHVVIGPDAAGLCGIPVHGPTTVRPSAPPPCPECALLLVAIAYPTRTGTPT